MIGRHPDSALLVEYASGSLELAPSIAITTHIQFCDQCRRTVESLQAVGGEMLEEAASVPVSDNLLDNVFAHIDSDSSQEQSLSNVQHEARQVDSENEVLGELASTVPAYIRKFLPAEPLKWRFLSPSLKTATISVGEDVNELSFLKIKAGGKAPVHTHTGTEITVVLKGCFSDEEDLYQPGDFIVRHAGETHQPIAAQNEECICLSVLSAPIQLTGIKSMLNPFLSFAPS